MNCLKLLIFSSLFLVFQVTYFSSKYVLSSEDVVITVVLGEFLLGALIRQMKNKFLGTSEDRFGFVKGFFDFPSHSSMYVYFCQICIFLTFLLATT